jgi:hypothetical protein
MKHSEGTERELAGWNGESGLVDAAPAAVQAQTQEALGNRPGPTTMGLSVQWLDGSG